MSFKEIKELRKAGKLEEALEMANQVLAADPENIWNKRAAAWVYYDYLKKYSQPDSFDSFKEYLIKIKDLALPKDEKMVFDNSAWQIGSMVFGLQRAELIDYGKINKIWDLAKGFHFTKPSEAFTFIYKAFHQGHQNWPNYLAFAESWGFENFRAEDYLKEEFKGRKKKAIAEKGFMAYAKMLIKRHASSIFEEEKEQYREKARVFLPKLEAVIEEHPEFQYLPYFKAKILLILGEKDNVLSSFLPFAKQKRNDFWVWEVMAEIFPQDEEIQFACYCKALSLKTPEDFLVKLRQRFAGLLVKRQMFNEAKTEIQKVEATREKEGWNLPSQIVLWTEQDWYHSAIPKKDNRDLYTKYLKKAEEILFQDIPEEIIAVEFVNQNKGMLNFVKNRKKFGFFKYSGQLEQPKIGDILKVRFNGEGKDGFYRVFSAKKAGKDSSSEAIRNFEGALKIIAPQNFGFSDDVFIEPKIIEKKRLTGGQALSGKAILSFNKKKQEWGWKALEVDD